MFVGSRSKHLSKQLALEQVGPYRDTAALGSLLPEAALFSILLVHGNPDSGRPTLGHQAFLIKVQFQCEFIMYKSFPFLFSMKAPFHQKYIGEACLHLGKGLCLLFSEGEVQIREGWVT